MKWLFGPPNVEKLKKNGDIEGLAKALKYKKDSYIRQKAAEALGKIAEKSAVNPLIAALKDENIDVRRKAVQALGTIGDPMTIACLITALKDKNRNNKIRMTIAETLERMGCNPSNTPELIDCLIEAENWEKLVEVGKPAIDWLITAIKDKNTNNYIRVNIAKTLMKIGVPCDEFAGIVEPAIDRIVDDIKDDNKYMYMLSGWIDALGWKGNKRAVAPLISALKSIYGSRDYVDKICAIAETLGRIDDLRAVEPLLSLLHFEDQPGISGPAYKVRRSAVVALGELGDEKAVEPLIAGFISDNCDREAVVNAVLKIGIPQEVKETLISTLISDHRSGKSYAAEYLELLGWKPESEEDQIDYCLAKKDIPGLKKIGRPAIERMIYLFKQIPAAEYFASSSNFGSKILMCLNNMDDETAKELIMKELKGKGQFCKIARDLLNSGDSSEDHCLCPKCFTYLGIRKELVKNGKTITAQIREEAKQRGIAIIGGEAYYHCSNCGDNIMV